MNGNHAYGFGFGIEAEFLLVDADTYRPLWYRDLNFRELNELLESVPLGGLPPLDGLELEAPHRKLMPFVVEGYHIPAPDLTPIDLQPKGIEIRTPVCESVSECLGILFELHERLSAALLTARYRLASLSHHPTEHYFEGPQNKRRYDYWQWAMEVMTTYGPDINVSLPQDLNDRVNTTTLSAKVNYYGPAMTAFTLAAPFYRGDLWRIRGRVGKSIRVYRRSVIAPAIELHPHESGRMEFKLFESTNNLSDYAAYFLLWLTVLIDDSLAGRASNQSRIYDLGNVARFGFEAETIEARAAELLEAADHTLPPLGFDPTPLTAFRERLTWNRVPADDLIGEFAANPGVENILRQRVGLRIGDFVDA